MAGTIREQSSSARELELKLLYRVFNCDRLLEAPVPPWAWHSEKLVIGRGETNSLHGTTFTLEDGRVSGQHAQLEAKGNLVLVKDLGSSNGTFLNGEKVGPEPIELREGDLLEVGRTLLTWRTVKASLAAKLIGGTTLGELRTVSPLFGEQLLTGARAAKTTEPVLLVGETGTGKDVLARALHQVSGRRGQFVAVDAGAIPETLFESTLFGHEKGAFTGATEARAGEIVRANKGTLFLDEVGNLSASSQARLLRVLETRYVTALGAKEGQHVDVRFIAATNRSVLESEEGFREDLVHRLAGFVLKPPPLRERKEDLGIIIKALLEDAGVKSATIAPLTARELYLDPLKGNVRGLRNVLRRAAVGHDTVHLEKLEGLSSTTPPGSEEPMRKRKTGAMAARPRGWVPTREELQKVLEKNGGSVAAAARELESYPRQLYRWLEELGMNPDDYR
ncbi:MAG: sigma 54-interacting transcriptional regulator [Archangiaceae bacterium]|nr:sigma 54-interacting transcriptional regulator [Archangiaceae bacterium]